ncbi:MAG: quinoprotein relay system zinc metallohydrolase 2 [Filomicrobium sp.]
MLKPNESGELMRLPFPDRRGFCHGLTLTAIAPLFSNIWSTAAVGLERFNITTVADGVFAHQGRHELQTPENFGDISNCGFIVGQDAVAVIDTGGSFRTGTLLREAVRAATDKPIKYVVNTHMHPDHVLGNAAFKDDQPTYVAHSKMARALSARSERYLTAAKEAMGESSFAGTAVILPTKSIAEKTELDLGGRKLIFAPQKTAHTDNDLTIQDTKTGTTFVGDLIFSGHIPTLDGSIVGWQNVLGHLGEEKLPLIVPGHGPSSMGWNSASKPVQRYLDIVAEQVRAVIKRGGTINDAIRSVGLSEQEKWELFQEFHSRTVTAAFAELEWE